MNTYTIKHNYNADKAISQTETTEITGKLFSDNIFNIYGADNWFIPLAITSIAKGGIKTTIKYNGNTYDGNTNSSDKEEIRVSIIDNAGNSRKPISVGKALSKKRKDFRD